MSHAPASKSVAIILIDEFADWEAALFTSSVRAHLGGSIAYLTEGAKPVTSMGGLTIRPDGDWRTFAASAHDALAIIGSPLWDRDDAPDIADAARAMIAVGKPTGFICGATLAAARAGLLDTLAHTSNALDFLKTAPAYRGESHYVSVAHAVRSGCVVTAPGTAPATFASALLALLYPDQAADIAGFIAAFGKEYQ